MATVGVRGLTLFSSAIKLRPAPRLSRYTILRGDNAVRPIRGNAHISIVQSEIGKTSTKFKGSKLWNDLPTDFKEIKSHSYFKFEIKD